MPSSPTSNAQAYFTQSDQGLVPRARARAPWAEDMLHGRLLGGIAARALEHQASGERWRASRLTVDLFRPAGMHPVSVRTEVVRSGRKVRVVDAHLTCDGHEVGRVRALFLVAGEEPPGNIWRPRHEQWPDPSDVPDTIDEAGDAEHPDWILRTVSGGMGTGQRSRIWTNDTCQLVEGEPMTPLVRAAVSGDLGCPLANSSDQGLFYINADYTLLLGRYPIGHWIGIGATNQIQADGISAATAVLVDRDGPFAMSGGTSLARPPLSHD